MNPVNTIERNRDKTGTTDPKSAIPDPGPGRLSGRQLPRHRAVPQGSGPHNLPYAPDGTLNILDILSGVFDDNGVWHYKPMVRCIFTGGYRPYDLGSCEYEEGDYAYEEDGVRYLLRQEEAEIYGDKKYLAVDKWVFLRDSVPRALFDGQSLSAKGKQNAAKLCDSCIEIDLNTRFSALHVPVDGCDLCRMLSRYSVGEDQRLVDARDRIRICSLPDAQNIDDLIHPGFPTFFRSGSQDHFSLIKHWLALCDEGKCGDETGCAPPCDQFRPTRLLCVSGGNEKVIPIITTSSTQEYSYVALSHCWGSQHSGIPPWCTTRTNLPSRNEAGIPFDSLPANFKDAVTVTRGLGKEYLWIDSLCIVQGDETDWKQEASKMADVFRGAYCVVAASSAADSTKGFLERSEMEMQHEYVLVNSASHGEVCFSTAVDDFSGDVQDAVLNSRAWVFQERALARRTLHFTQRQTYFECGGGVRCETGTYMKNEGSTSLFSDNSFPYSLQFRAEVAKLKLFSDFFATYSGLGITNATDRPIAILALAQDLAATLNTRLVHGVFEKFLHRGVLWRRKQAETLPRIDFNLGKAVAAPPSWSWMAHKGSIIFAEMEDYFEWDARVAFSAENDKALCAPVAHLRLLGYETEAEDGSGTGILAMGETGEQLGTLWFDDGRERIAEEVVQRVAVLGQQVAPEGVDLGDQQRVYVLLVDEVEGGAFQRVGMGMVNCVLVEGNDVLGRII
ncbi:heterokaryon incompatibility protein 6 [Cladorrhinum sp. PSN332]|nr:heterokaryon incompatibility protein 6 [Cladorrhinum sp. PSN332]